MSGEHRHRRMLATRVGARAELLDLRVRRIQAELHQPAAEGPFTLALVVKPAVSRADSLAVYNLEYDFSSQDSDEKLVVDGTIEFSVIYQVPADLEPSDDDLTAFGQIVVLSTAYPYLREILHTLTTRMGLPPLILEILRSDLDPELAGSPS